MLLENRGLNVRRGPVGFTVTPFKRSCGAPPVPVPVPVPLPLPLPTIVVRDGVEVGESKPSPKLLLEAGPEEVGLRTTAALDGDDGRPGESAPPW